MAKDAMPTSKATNAYELLEEIEQIILEEPRRYDQTQWLSKNVTVEEYKFAPSCGTIGCVAGWVVALKGAFFVLDVAAEASDILGLNVVQKWKLFDADKAGPRSEVEDGCETLTETEQTITEHAERGAKHIRSFRKTHAEQLKAKAV